MSVNTRFKTAGVDEVVPLVVIFTSNTPTPSATQTISNGTVPTVAELGQYVANNQVVMAQMQADLDKMRAALAD